MSAMHPISPIIRTSAYSRLREVARAALDTARLGIVRGPVGIGKSFALRQIEEELSQGEDRVFLVEAPADKSASVQRFYQKALFDLGFSGHGSSDPFGVFKGFMLRAYGMIGFVSGFGRRGVLLVAAVLAAGGLRAAAFPMRREFFANA